MPKFQFGKYAGQDYADVPEDYLQYLIGNSEQQLLYCKAELERRKIKVEDSFMSRIVAAGYAELMKTIPGDSAKLGLARDALNRAITDAAQPKGI